MIGNILAVFFGGALGALFRFLISEFLPVIRWGIPFTIIIVNFTGCFIMGFADSFYESKIVDSYIRYFLTVGLLGGFTTFSTFSLEFYGLIKSGNIAGSFIYLFISVFMSLAGFIAGYTAARLLK
ncbi:MAG: fluoride efflux transporter CrcB [Endomicrobium sp.]|jgi:CrcB protein|nr:fluoride efflux transporter CrcB [Endomicrobium sp.]